MEVKDWCAGDLLCIAAGMAVLSSADMAWVRVTDPPAALGGLVLGMYAPLALVLALGLALVAAGMLRTIWAALVALGSSFGIAIVILMISEGAPVALQAYAPGVAGHGDGFGVSVLLSAGLLAGLAGVVVAVQREPKVVTRPGSHAPL